MKISFSKYQGTGNDFIMLDNLSGSYDLLSIHQVQVLCDRKFGVGADGLIKINKSEHTLFEMDYYNSDGSKSFCGNGARCSVAFAETLGILTENIRFTGIDGEHYASRTTDFITLQMLDVKGVRRIGPDYELYTGSPHYIRFVENSLELDVFHEGKKIRYSPEYAEEGINVNFVEELRKNEIEVSTYERGVEDETLSCGTGVTAAALIYAEKNKLSGKQEILVHTKGGKLNVSLNRLVSNEFTEIALTGPAQFIFKGEIDV